MSYRVAIIVPTLNEELYIFDCLNSIQKQTFPFGEMDVMIVDGGSKDRTREIVSDYSLTYPNVRLLDNPGRIQSIAFNIGVANSTAPFVVRLDAHALYDEHYVECCVDLLSKNPDYGNVGGVCQTLPKSKGLIPESIAILAKSTFGIGGTKFRVGCEAGPVDTVPFGAFRRETIERIGGMREDLPRAEDNEYNSRIHKYGYTVYLDPRIVSTYYARPNVKGILKQMYNNGDSIGHLFYVDRAAIGLRHFVPFAFVMATIITLIGGIFWKPLFYLFLCAIGLYFVVDICASLNASVKYGWKNFLVLPWLFFLVHIAYGWGTIVGIVNGK